MYVKDGKLEKVEGDPEHPFNQGKICPRCAALPDVINHPQRLQYPMKRDPSKRGNPDAWEKITWDEAYDLWETEFKRLQAEYGTGTVQGFQGTGRNIMWENQRLVYSMGSPHVVSYISGISCWMPRMVAHVMVAGNYTQVDCSQVFEDRWEHEGFKVPEIILVWGNDCSKSSSDGFLGSWIIECVQRGSKLIVADPRLTWFAARADIWLQLRPASDSALTIAFLKTIIDEDLYDHDFVDKWTYGFDELKEALSQYDIDELCERAWVPADKLRAAARMYAAGNNSAIQLGLSLDMQSNGITSVHTLIAAMAICNNLDAPGGNIYTPDPGGVSTFGWGWEHLTEKQQKELIGYYEYPMIGMGMRLDQPDLMLFQAEADEPQPYRAAYMIGTNPLTCMSCSDLSRVYKVMQKLEFIVGMDYIMTPTMQALADLCLPIAMYPEKKSIRSWYANISAITPAVGLERNGDCKSDQEIIIDIGSRFNYDMFPWDDVDGMYDAMLEPAPLNYEELTDMRWWYDPSIEYYKYEKGQFRLDGKPGFPTPTGRIELYSTIAESIGAPPLPYYAEPYQSPYASPDVYEKYPVVTITGTRNIQFFHSEHRHIGKLREICPDPTFEINPEYAKSLGIKEGDWCWIENDLGRIRQRAHLTNIIDYRCINLQSGWWFPEMDPHDDPMYGCWDVNPNILIDPGHQGRTGFGADFKALLCKVYRVKEGEM
jgi:anaerobic selenocysteine-containing dehydrogenase